MNLQQSKKKIIREINKSKIIVKNCNTPQLKTGRSGGSRGNKNKEKLNNKINKLDYLYL